MKNTIGHPDALHNYLVECSTQTRELFYLGCQLNRLDGMILSRTITKHMIRRLYEMRSDLINKENSRLKIAKKEKKAILISIPEFDKEVHGSITKYIKLKKQLKVEIEKTLNPEELATMNPVYTTPIVPHNTKLVYMKVYELEA